MIANGIAQEVAVALGVDPMYAPRCRHINVIGGVRARGWGHVGWFSLPGWIFDYKHPFFYLIYYVAHEVCHHFHQILRDRRRKFDVHGEEFMAMEAKCMRYFGIRLEYVKGIPYPKRLHCAGQTFTHPRYRGQKRKKLPISDTTKIRTRSRRST
jgi:hypothetical protein